MKTTVLTLIIVIFCLTAYSQKRYIMKVEKDILGNLNAVYYDMSGNRVARSYTSKDILGNTTTKYMDPNGNSIGEKYTEKDAVGNDNSIYRNEYYETKGYSTGNEDATGTYRVNYRTIDGDIGTSEMQYDGIEVINTTYFNDEQRAYYEYYKAYYNAATEAAEDW